MPDKAKLRTHIILPDRLSSGQFRAALEIFRDAADEDYVISRLAYKKMLGRQFLWSSNQAIEKYLKAASLCNGKDADFGHDWIKKYKELTDFASRNSYQEIPILRPPAMALSALAAATGFLYEEPTLAFAERLCAAGQPTIRYNEFSWIDVEPFDLHKLDTLVRWLRGLCFPLDGLLEGDDNQNGVPDPALLGFKKLVDKNPDLVESNYAFFPEASSGTICAVNMSAKPFISIAFRGDDVVLKWLLQSTKLTEKTLSEIMQQFEVERSRGAE